jgi:hypothetical protein
LGFFFFFETLAAGLATPAFSGIFTTVRILVVGASVVVVVVVVVVGVCFTALPDVGKVFNAMIKTTAKISSDNECMLVCIETTMRT